MQSILRRYGKSLPASPAARSKVATPARASKATRAHGRSSECRVTCANTPTSPCHDGAAQPSRVAAPSALYDERERWAAPTDSPHHAHVSPQSEQRPSEEARRAATAQPRASSPYLVARSPRPMPAAATGLVHYAAPSVGRPRPADSTPRARARCTSGDPVYRPLCLAGSPERAPIGALSWADPPQAAGSTASAEHTVSVARKQHRRAAAPCRASPQAAGARRASSPQLQSSTAARGTVVSALAKAMQASTLGKVRNTPGAPRCEKPTDRRQAAVVTAPPLQAEQVLTEQLDASRAWPPADFETQHTRHPAPQRRSASQPAASQQAAFKMPLPAAQVGQDSTTRPGHAWEVATGGAPRHPDAAGAPHENSTQVGRFQRQWAARPSASTSAGATERIVLSAAGDTCNACRRIDGASKALQPLAFDADGALFAARG